ncbi:MAG: TOBE domain-containing protein [Burkholderiales bacterium]|nr:TOBE domain-containing protein [Burkholderiales bacterium]
MRDSSSEIALQGSVWLTVGGESLGGAARIALLAQIAQCGSITQAAKAVGMSYKGAWDAIDAMNNLAGEALVERVAGGKGGGGTRLTARGSQLVDNFRVIEQEHRRFIEQLAQQADKLTEDYVLIKRMGMRTSARNQYLGTVSAIRTGAVNDEIELTLPTGHTLVAIVTHESTQNLNLQVGEQAFALIKSSSIIVMTDDAGAKLSARNRFTGVVSRIVPGAVNTEVLIDLGSGQSIAAVITNDSCESLGLAMGQPASALFKASSVILGIPT